MEELFELKAHIEKGNYAEALTLIGEMEEMSRDDKIIRVGSFLEIILIHLIKKHAEKRSTRSWEVSIRNSVRAIERSNKRRKGKGYYLTEDELKETIDEVYPTALDRASLEAFEGQYDEIKLAQMVDEKQIKNQALELILKEQTSK